MAYTDMERRILDMWPKFEDGKYVMYEDEFDFNGEVKTAHGFNFGIGGRVSICSDKGSHVRLPNGERVKRPAPKVLDADGVEIKVGDRVYSISNGNSYIVRAINGSGTLEFEGSEYKGWFPTIFTHTQPAIDADGVLIKVGDTVWHHSGFAHGVVTSIDASSLISTVRYSNGYAEFRDAAKDLTHIRPDSWERLEKDAESIRQTIARNFGDFSPSDFKQSGDSLQDRVSDLIRRAKKLAEKEAGR